jgi:hypothetical protein
LFCPLEAGAGGYAGFRRGQITDENAPSDATLPTKPPEGEKVAVLTPIRRGLETLILTHRDLSCQPGPSREIDLSGAAVPIALFSGGPIAHSVETLTGSGRGG